MKSDLDWIRDYIGRYHLYAHNTYYDVNIIDIFVRVEYIENLYDYSSVRYNDDFRYRCQATYQVSTGFYNADSVFVGGEMYDWIGKMIANELELNVKPRVSIAFDFDIDRGRFEYDQGNKKILKRPPIGSHIPPVPKQSNIPKSIPKLSEKDKKRIELLEKLAKDNANKNEANTAKKLVNRIKKKYDSNP